MEIVAVDISPDGACVEGQEHPVVRWLKKSDVTSMGAARAECVRAARGTIVAFIEDHAYAHPEWAEALIAAFERGVDIVSYAMTTANPERRLSRAFMMAEYGRWLDPAVPGPIPISTSNNVAYRREALLPFLDRLERLLEVELVLHREMQARGARIWLAADARVAHESWTRFRDGLHANCVMKRVIGAGRASEGGWGAPTRLAWAAAMPMTPLLHIARLARSLVGRPALWPLFWMSLPLMIVLYGASAWSEAQGYLFGFGGASARFRDLEIAISRD
jgi:hypothetical protein